jgi:hypothetical protein
MFAVFLALKIANLCWWAKSRSDFGVHGGSFLKKHGMGFEER